MKKLLSLFLTTIMVLSLGCISTLAVTDYTEIRLAKSNTTLSYTGSGTLKAEGFNGTSWEAIDPSLVEFSSQSRFVEINENGVFKLTNEFQTAYKGTTDEKSLSTPITASYTLSNGTKLTKKVLVMFGSASPNKIIAADANAKTNTLTYTYAVDFADGLTGTKVTSSEAAKTTSDKDPLVSSQDSFYEGWFYDIDGTSQSDSSVGIIRFANDAQGSLNVFNFYLKTNGTNYALADSLGTGEFSGNASSGGKVVAPRSIGWHQFAVDVCSGNRVRAYLDGELIYEKTIAFSGNPGMRKVVPGTGGKFYYDKFNILRSKVNTNVKPQVSYSNIKGAVSDGSEITADYDVIFPNSHKKAEPLYQWQKATSMDGEYTDIDGATSNKYTIDSALDEGGKPYFFRIKITPKSLNGTEEITGSIYASNPVSAPIAPIVKENSIKVTGINFLGVELKASYEFFDVNNDEEDIINSIYKWYRLDSADDDTPTLIDGANSKNYTVTSDDEGKYIVFSVQPKSFGEEPTLSAKEYFSEPIAPYTKPVAKNVEITGEYGIGKTLTGSYDFESTSNSEEGETVIKWYRGNDVIYTYKKGDEGALSYTVTTEDIDSDIYLEITPKSSNYDGILSDSDCTGTAEKSAAFKGAVNPIGLSAYLSGALRPGNTISVEYTYTHEKDIPEGNTEYRIYVGGELKSNTKTLYITADMAGKSIYAVVYPKAAVEPSTGASIQTASSVIGYAVSTPITVGSGGGGGGGSYASQDTPETLALKAVKNAIVLKINSNNALLNGYTAKVDENTMVSPFIENSRTLLPLRFIAESLGAKVMWTDETREIKITSGSNTVIMHLDSDIYTINGIEYKMDVKAKSVSGRTMIPVRYISEALNKEVFWDDKGIVIVSDKKNIFDSSKDSSLIDALITKLK